MCMHSYKNLYIYISILNVAPGPLRSVKQPGKAKTAQFHQKWRLIRKTKLHKSRYLYIFIYIYIRDGIYQAKAISPNPQ